MTKQQQTTRDQTIADRASVARSQEYQWRRQLIEERLLAPSRAQNERMAQAKIERDIRYKAGKQTAGDRFEGAMQIVGSALVTLLILWVFAGGFNLHM